MVREYLKQNVYDALLERLDFIFREFDNIYISFSGGKDSGLLLNLLLDFRDKHYPDRPIGVFHQDFEAQYTVTTEYIERTFIPDLPQRGVQLYQKQKIPYRICGKDSGQYRRHQIHQGYSQLETDVLLHPEK